MAPGAMDRAVDRGGARLYGVPVLNPGIDFPAAIEEHSSGFATAADGNLDAAVVGCPGWPVRDLVRHLIEVQWFWSTIVELRLSAPPKEASRPAPPDDAHLLSTFRAGAEHLVSALRSADPNAACWTWAPQRQDVAFVIRHQAQEAAVHHWDAAQAAGHQAEIDPELAADAVDEFLTYSVSGEADPADPPRPPLDGRLTLRCTDLEAAWTVENGIIPGTVVHHPGAAWGVPEMGAPAAQLLLWMYRRVPLDTGPVPSELADRLRALCFTD